MDAITFDQKLKKMFEESYQGPPPLDRPVFTPLPGTLNFQEPDQGRKPKYVPYNEFKDLYGLKDQIEAFDKLGPKKNTGEQLSHLSAGKNAALGEAIGAFGSLMSAVRGGPVQDRSAGLKKSEAHLSRYEQLLEQYEQDQRQHELLKLQQEISSRKAYGDYRLNQDEYEKRRQDMEADQTTRFDQSVALQNERYRQQNETYQQNYQNDLDLIKARGDEARKTNYARPATTRSTTAAKTYDITDPSNRSQVLYSLTPDQRRMAEQIAVNSAMADPNLLRNNPALYDKARQRKPFTAKDREDVMLMLTTGQNASPDVLRYLNNGQQPQRQAPVSPNNKGAWQGGIPQSQGQSGAPNYRAIAQEYIKSHPDSEFNDINEIIDLMNYLTPEELEAFLQND